MLDVERLIWGMLGQPERWEWNNEYAWFDRPTERDNFGDRRPARLVLCIKHGWIGLRIQSVSGQTYDHDLDLIGRYFLWRRFKAMRTRAVKIAILAGPMMAGSTADEYKSKDAQAQAMLAQLKAKYAIQANVVITGSGGGGGGSTGTIV